MRDGRLTDKLSIREQTPGIWCGVTSSVATAGPPFFSIGQPPDEPSGLSRLFRENHPYFNSDNVRRDTRRLSEPGSTRRASAQSTSAATEPFGGEQASGSWSVPPHRKVRRAGGDREGQVEGVLPRHAVRLP